MEIFIDIVAVILGIVGLLGCILPVLPGPPCSLAGMFLLCLWGSPCAQDDITWRLLIIMLIVTVVVTVLDYVVPGWLTRVTGGTKYASRGATAGMIVGILFFPPWGMIAGAFIGALRRRALLGREEDGTGSQGRSRLLPRFPARYRSQARRLRSDALLHRHRPHPVNYAILIMKFA